MSAHPAVYGPLRLASATAGKRARAKCDRDVKLHLPEALYDDLAQLARADSRAVGEYMRVVLERHTYGALGAYRG
ncbi:MAG: hypothetical protein LM550_12190 [Candidatus Contendobacter sp.]|nr:hypothetical protein [Candidatus Contendobacter sp.]